MFSFHLRQRNLKTHQSSRDNHDVIVFRKVSFLKSFRACAHENAGKVGVFKLLRFKESFGDPFSWRISEDGRLNRRNKAAFSNFSGEPPRMEALPCKTKVCILKFREYRRGKDLIFLIEVKTVILVLLFNEDAFRLRKPEMRALKDQKHTR